MGKESDQDMKDLVCKCLHACNEGFSAEDKYQAYKLGLRIIQSQGDVELASEEAAFIKRVSAHFMNAGPYGQVVDAVEGGGR